MYTFLFLSLSSVGIFSWTFEVCILLIEYWSDALFLLSISIIFNHKTYKDTCQRTHTADKPKSF